MRVGSWKQKFSLGALFGLLFVGAFALQTPQAHAGYVENNLIDDSIYLDAASMNQSDIQAFLNGRGGWLASGTFWSDRDNAQVPAARIIYEAAQDYGVSPKVIMATIQKEQSLITDPSPAQSQVDFAMGYACYDSTGCSKYRGFYNQVDNGAWQLRFNLERARGNNSWWNPNLTYPCNGATRYYSNALKAGNWVTFYDEVGTAYKSFTINNGATGSLYCYTPHAYPGSQAKYYSGSYNFVLVYEQWFGSTQPSVVVDSSLGVSGLPQGIFTNMPVTVQFTMRNNYNWPIGIGSVAVAVRDQNGGNHDFALQPITLPAHGRYTYTATQSLPAEGTYTFWITNLHNGVWSDDKPVSSSIDIVRSRSFFVPAMPTITVQPTFDVPDMRINKAANVSFTVKNNSAQSFNIGKIGLAMRDPLGRNADFPLQPVTIAAGGTYQYTGTMTPKLPGTYRTFVTATRDNGLNWNESSYPAPAAGVSRTVDTTVKASPTLTQGPVLSIPTPRVGQATNMTFKVRNYGDTAVNAGRVVLAIRDPHGRNVDPASAQLSVNANSEFTFSASSRFATAGTHTAWISLSGDNGATWDETTYPLKESDAVARKITFTVLPNPTVTVGPSVTTSDPREGGQVTATFTVHNYGDNPWPLGKMALAARDPQGRNADFPLVDVTVPAGGDYVYTQTRKLDWPGLYILYLTTTFDGINWDDKVFPAMENPAAYRYILFSVKQNPTLTVGPNLSDSTPQVGQQVTAGFTVRNWVGQSVPVGRIGMAIRGPNGQNYDPGSSDVTINANGSYNFSAPVTFNTPGTYTMWVTVTRDGGANWDDTTFPAAESGSVLRKVQFTVQP